MSTRTEQETLTNVLAEIGALPEDIQRMLPEDPGTDSASWAWVQGMADALRAAARDSTARGYRLRDERMPRQGADLLDEGEYLSALAARLGWAWAASPSLGSK